VIKRLITLSCAVLALSTTACSSGSDKISNNDTKDGRKKVVLSVYEASDFYKQAKMKFEEKHPDMMIEIKEYAAEGGSEEGKLEKYVQTTNTQLLSGKGADLIDLNVSGLQVGKYVNKNALANLNEFMNNDKSFDSSLYYMNIFEHVKMNGGLYALPTRFFLDLLAGDSEGIKKAKVQIDDKDWTWSQFAKAGKLLNGKEGRYAMGNTPPEQMLGYLVADNYSTLVDMSKRKADFGSPFFTDMLKQVKAMYDDKVITAGTVDFGDAYFYPTLLSSPDEYFTGPAEFFKQGKLYSKPHVNGQKPGVSFMGYMNIAMNANSKVKPEAWEFIKFLLSEDVQTQPRLQGFSVIKSVNEKKLEALAAKGSLATNSGAEVPVSAEGIQALKQMIANANIFITNDDKIQSIVAEEAKAYFSGQKSADDVAKLIQNRVTTYINE